MALASAGGRASFWARSRVVPADQLVKLGDVNVDRGTDPLERAGQAIFVPAAKCPASLMYRLPGKARRFKSGWIGEGNQKWLHVCLRVEVDFVA